MKKNARILKALTATAMAAIVAGIAWIALRTPAVDGIYTGVVPCADCEGISTTLALSNGRYVLELEYLGKPGGPIAEAGTYSYRSRDVIQLGSEPIFYKVASEDILLQLDRDGNEIESQFNYSLKII